MPTSACRKIRSHVYRVLHLSTLYWAHDRTVSIFVTKWNECLADHTIISFQLFLATLSSSQWNFPCHTARTFLSPISSHAKFPQPRRWVSKPCSGLQTPWLIHKTIKSQKTNGEKDPDKPCVLCCMLHAPFTCSTPTSHPNKPFQ